VARSTLGLRTRSLLAPRARPVPELRLAVARRSEVREVGGTGAPADCKRQQGDRAVAEDDDQALPLDPGNQGADAEVQPSLCPAELSLDFVGPPLVVG